MALKGLMLSLLCLKVFFPGLCEKNKKSEEETPHPPVLGHPGQEAMKLRIGVNRTQSVRDLFLLFLEDLFQLAYFLRGPVFRSQPGNFRLDDFTERKDIDNIIPLMNKRGCKGLNKGFLAGSNHIRSVALAPVDKLHRFQREK